MTTLSAGLISVVNLISNIEPELIHAIEVDFTNLNIGKTIIMDSSGDLFNIKVKFIISEYNKC